MILEGGRGGVCIEKSIPRGRGGGRVCIEKSIRGGGGGGSELSDQLLDPDVPTLASQDKLKVSPKGLPFVTSMAERCKAPSIAGSTNIRPCAPRGSLGLHLWARQTQSAAFERSHA